MSRRKQNEMKKKPGVYTAKNGRKYRILPNGQARFLKSTTKKTTTKKTAKRKGGALRTGGAMRTGGKVKRGGAAMSGGKLGFVHY